MKQATPSQYRETNRFERGSWNFFFFFSFILTISPRKINYSLNISLFLFLHPAVVEKHSPPSHILVDFFVPQH